MPKINGWIIEGKYTKGPGSEWEVIDEVAPNDPEGATPGELIGREYAYWLCNEYITATPSAQHRVRPAKLDR
jgi:hypothetical protein